MTETQRGSRNLPNNNQNRTHRQDEPRPGAYARVYPTPDGDDSMIYQGLIAEDLASMGRSDIPPAWIEGWMRLEHGVLDSLSRERFRKEVAVAAECVDAGGIERSEWLAESFGF